jgi:hypothetical protein
VWQKLGLILLQQYKAGIEVIHKRPLANRWQNIDKRSMRYIKYLAVTLVLFLIVFTGVLSRGNLSSLVWQNWGWLRLAHAAITPQTSAYVDAQEAFDQAIQWQPANQRAWVGNAIAAIHQSDLVGASSSWHNAGVAPEFAASYGDMMLEQSFDPQLAFTAYRAAASLYPAKANRAAYAASAICQRLWADLVAQPAELTQYCQTVFQENQENLLLNAQFVDGAPLGWTGDFFFEPAQAELAIESNQGYPPPAITMTGSGHPEVFGLYQVFCFEPGTTIHFSGWFKVEVRGEMIARILYTGWTQNDAPQGTQAEVISESIGWSYFEREFQLPDGSSSWLLLWPALIQGQGTVWADELRVQIIEQPIRTTNSRPLCS